MQSFSRTLVSNLMSCWLYTGIYEVKQAGGEIPITFLRPLHWFSKTVPTSMAAEFKSRAISCNYFQFYITYLDLLWRVHPSLSDHSNSLGQLLHYWKAWTLPSWLRTSHYAASAGLSQSNSMIINFYHEPSAVVSFAMTLTHNNESEQHKEQQLRVIAAKAATLCWCYMIQALFLKIMQRPSEHSWVFF